MDRRFLPAVSLLALGCIESTAPSIPLRFVSITAGSYHTCALTASGEAYCWGGEVSLSDFSTPTLKNAHTQPTAIEGGLRFVTLSTSSGNSTCGITATGAAHCWGATLRPVAVPGGVSFASLASADQTTCGLDADRAAYCWGNNNGFGQLGTGRFGPDGSDFPIPVNGGLRFTRIATSIYYHSCALSDASVAYCWGANSSGALGDGTQENRSAPVPVGGGVSFVALTVGWVHSCALTSAGAAYCWGAGQTRDGSGTHALSPVAVAGGLAFRAISAGRQHTCGLTLEGSAYCWGSNPALAQTAAPTAVPGGLIFTSLTTGGDHACGLATDGLAYCWGQNMLGQLGDGTVTDQDKPVLVRRQ
jgi:alpha-tubulin suppressor-like RCC1 family protein